MTMWGPTVYTEHEGPQRPHRQSKNEVKMGIPGATGCLGGSEPGRPGHSLGACPRRCSWGGPGGPLHPSSGEGTVIL